MTARRRCFPLVLSMFSMRSNSGHFLWTNAGVSGSYCMLTISVMIICADVWAVSWEPLCCDIRQLTCRRDCLTFSGWLRLSTLIWTRLSEASGATATLTLSLIYHAPEACLPCRLDTFPLLGQRGWGVYSQRWFQQSELNFHWWGFAVCVRVRREISYLLLFTMLAAKIGLMSPTWFNPSKYHHQVHNLMIHIMKTGYKLRSS